MGKLSKTIFIETEIETKTEKSKSILSEQVLLYDKSISDRYHMIQESRKKFAPDKIIDKMAGKKSVLKRTFWGWFFAGPIGAIIMYIKTKDKNMDIGMRANELRRIAYTDPKSRKILQDIKSAIRRKEKRSVLKRLRTEFREALYDAELLFNPYTGQFTEIAKEIKFEEEIERQLDNIKDSDEKIYAELNTVIQ